MPTRRRFVRVLGAGAAAATAGCLGGGGASGGGDRGGEGGNGSGSESTARGDGAGGSPGTPAGGGGSLALASSAFGDGDSIPRRFTCAGENVSPPLSLSGVPDGAGALAFVVDDPDAPGKTPYVHWLLWNVPADVTSLPEGVPTGKTVDSLGGAKQGTNSGGTVGYGGPCPPRGDGPHTYRFTCHALDSPLDLAAGAKRPALDDAMAGPAVTSTTLTATFERK
ncbi:MAG: YbhB/YbcL family Raf kinase inhibitor-like protein [Salinigranum sp.]